MGAFAKFGLYGIRRPIRIIPQQMTHVWHGKALHLTFDLPSGAYATVVIEALEKVIAEDEKRRASVRGRDLAMKAGEKPLKQERKRITDPVALAKKARELQEKYAPKNVAPLPPESIIPGRTDGHKTHSAKKGIEKKPVTDSSKRPAKKINPYTGQPMREKTKKSGSRASSV